MILNMSFLVSFNGQFSPYVHPSIDAWHAKVNSVNKLDPIDPKEVEYQVSQDGKNINHQTNSRTKGYEQQVKIFEKEKKRFYARDIMSSPIHFLHKKTSVNEAIILMRKFGFRHLPILNDQENLAGLLSDRELVGAKPHSLCEELMIPKVLVGLHNARIQEIAHIMLQEKINALPIINEKHQLVGIITQSDILKFVIGSDEFLGLA